MRTTHKYMILITIILMSSLSCTDILDQKANTDFYEETIWNDINLAKSYLGYCYDRIGSHSSYILGMREDLLSSCTDELWCIHRPSGMVFLKGTMTANNLGHFGNPSRFGFLNWSGIYDNIQNLNIFLDNIDKVPVNTSADEKLKTQIKGEAYFLRAYEYAQLLFGYGGVIIVDKPFKTNQDLKSINRCSLKRTLDFILLDIENAISYLPKGNDIEQGRATQGAAAALKSRLLLFCASNLVNGGYNPADTLVSFTNVSQADRWLAAKNAAKELIDGTFGFYSLTGTTSDPPNPITESAIKAYADNYYNIFNQKGTWNNETIWGIQYPETGGNINKANLWNGPKGYHNWGNNEPTEPIVRSFEMADGTPFQWDIYNPGDQLLRTATAAEIVADPNRNPYNGREPRFYASILYHGAKWQTRPTDVIQFEPMGIIQTGRFYYDNGSLKAYGLDSRLSLVEIWSGQINGYHLKKFMDINIQGQYQNNTNTWIEFRYAEVLLNFAEACIELGGTDLQNGLDALNMVRNRAGLPDRVTSDQTTARMYLRHERAIELFAEGHRWYDIRRWMIADSVIKNVNEMKIKEFENGNMEWWLDTQAICDLRTFDSKNYWLPIPGAEISKSPQIRNNPGY